MQVRRWAVEEQLAPAVTWQGWVPEVLLLARRRCGLMLAQMVARQLASWRLELFVLTPSNLIASFAFPPCSRPHGLPRYHRAGAGIG